MPELLHRAVAAQLENIEAARPYFPEDEEPDFQTAKSHYISRRFGWDLHIIAIAMSRLGGNDIVNKSAYTLQKQLEGMHPNGFLPNTQFYEADKTWHFWRLEQWLFKDRRHSNYDQPYLLSDAIDETYIAYLRQDQPESARQLLDNTYEQALTMCFYYRDIQRMGPDNPLVFEIHPHGTGRDSDASLKPKLPRRLDILGRNVLKPVLPAIDVADIAFDNLWTISQTLRLKLAGWELEKAKKIYGRQDVMKNCAVVTNTLKTARLARRMAENHPEAAERYLAEAAELEQFAAGLEQRILDDMWFPDEVWSPKTRSKPGAFYTLDKKGKPVKQMSIGNLMVVTLPNLSVTQLETTLNLITTSFGTKYGLPSQPKDSKYYDPHHKRVSRLWGGSTWPHMNVLIAEGLRMQAGRPAESFSDAPDGQRLEQLRYLCNVVADMLAGIARELTEEVYAEYYDPETKQPQRWPHVDNFGMAMLADATPYSGLLEAENRHNYFDLCRKLGRVVRLDSFEFEQLSESA